MTRRKKDLVFLIRLAVGLSLLTLPAYGDITHQKDAEVQTPDTPEFTDDWTGRSLPKSETGFIDIIRKAQGASLQGLDKDTVRRQRQKALEAYRDDRIDHWIGLLSHMPDDGGDGHISIRITIAKDITLETDFNIAPTSAILKAANLLPYGTIVEVSGQFMKDPQQKDYFEETRITESGGLESPSFKIQMTSFKALD